MFDCVEEFRYLNSKGELNDCNALVLEYATKGDLFNFVQGHDAFEEKYIRYMLKQLLSALEHVHENGFAHLDIKLENVYLTQ
jgi:NUAK family SNF1-like kinase